MNSDIDDLIASISRIDLNKMPLTNPGSSQQSSVTIPNIEIRPLDLIPEFDGTPHKLYRFLSLVDETITQYWDTTDHGSLRNRFIFNSIVSKIKGRAEETISISGAKTWPMIKTTLLNTFGDQRDENALLSDLVQTRQKPNEDPISFYYRIISVLNHLTNYINLYEENAQIRQSKVQTYNSQALRTLIIGLKEPVQSMIRSLKPVNLAEALKYLTEDANIRYMSRQNNFYQNQKPIQKTPQPPMQNFNMYRQFQPFRPPFQQQQNFPAVNQFSNRSQFSAPSQFPRGPINIQPRNLPPQRFPTNSQVFGKNQNLNVWKPKPNSNTQNNSPPTPMSVSTRNTAQPQRPNFQQPKPPNFQQRPRYTFEELYNLENPCDYQTPNEEYYQYPYEQYYDETYFENLYEPNHYSQNFDQQDEQTENNTDENFRTDQPTIEET